MEYLRDWLRNLFTDLLFLGTVCIGMLIFVKIFYPYALTGLFLAGKVGVGLANALRLWPLIILVVIVYALPRRRPRREQPSKK